MSRRIAAALAVAAVLTGCTAAVGDPHEVAETVPLSEPSGSAPSADRAGPQVPLLSARVGRPVVRNGLDWSLPRWVRPADDSGFFSEDASPGDRVMVRSIDVSWAQVAPEPDAPLDLSSTGEAQGMQFEPLGEQLAEKGPYWVRMFASGAEWAPDWVTEECDVRPVGRDYDGQRHLPIWDDCVWDALRTTWRQLLVDEGLLDDRNFRFAYVPGAFTWSEFDYEIITQAVNHGRLDRRTYLRWYARMVADLADIGGDDVGRLVFTGEDYPWGPFGRADDLLTTDAVRAGMGVRTGIAELANFHLSETPAYGSRVRPNGHLSLWRSPHDQRVRATENECYVDCGYHTDHFGYSVTTSNLKALQLQLNWLYVVPGPSGLDRLPEHWDWVRLSLGQRPGESADAWAALREAEDRYWRWEDGPFGPGGREWRGRPFVRNWERWLVQRDVAPLAVARRSHADVHRGDIEPDNGVAYEGLRTNLAGGSPSLAFDVDEAFLDPSESHDVLVKVTFLDRGEGSWRLRWPDGRSPAIGYHGSGKWRTATVRVPALRPDDSLPGSTDLWLTARGSNLTARFVRVVRLTAP